MLQRKEKCCWENYSSVAAAIWCSMPHLTGQTQSSLVGSPADCLTQPAPAPLNVYPTGLPCPKAPSSGKGACCTRLKSNPTRLERDPTKSNLQSKKDDRWKIPSSFPLSSWIIPKAWSMQFFTGSLLWWSPRCLQLPRIHTLSFSLHSHSWPTSLPCLP